MSDLVERLTQEVMRECTIWVRGTPPSRRCCEVAIGDAIRLALREAALVAQAGPFRSDFPHDPKTCKRIAVIIEELAGP